MLRIITLINFIDIFLANPTGAPRGSDYTIHNLINKSWSVYGSDRRGDDNSIKSAIIRTIAKKIESIRGIYLSSCRDIQGVFKTSIDRYVNDTTVELRNVDFKLDQLEEKMKTNKDTHNYNRGGGFCDACNDPRRNY